ncbi:hypothetical protein VTO42DRAFT_7349 [Malbranchea cinnamomea]
MASSSHAQPLASTQHLNSAIADSKPASSSSLAPILNPNVNAPLTTTADLPPASSSDGLVRKRKSNSGSRGVANLTPEQLAKKRANDREAQRAIRKRTKARIEELEKRVRELESRPLYQELQEALRQKDAVLSENEELRRKLSSVIEIIQPVLNSPGASASVRSGGFSGNGSNPRSDNHSLGPHLPPSPASHSDLSNGASSNPASFDQPLRASASLESASYAGSPASLDTSCPIQPAQGYKQNWQSSTTSALQGEQEWSLSSAFDSQRRNLMHNLDFSGTGERLGLNFLLGSTRQVPKINETRRISSSPSVTIPARYLQPPNVSQNGEFAGTNLLPYSVPIRNVEPTCPLDVILLDFLRSRQREAAEGVSGRQLVGPPYPSVSSLLNPEKSVYSHPLSKVFTDILRTFPDISNLPEQVAVLYTMFLLMRWQIYPTQENYDRLPHWMTPRASQILTPHPAWMDYLPWPAMRDRMIANHQDYDFSNWFIPYTTTLSVNWPYEATDTLLSTPDSEELMINPVFESHLRNLNNWSLGPAFARAYPHLVDTTRIKPDLKDQGP